MLLGCVADDLTGATDLTVMLARNGTRTVQSTDAPQAALPDADAVVIALKSRTIPAKDAVALSLEALAWLKQAGHQAVSVQVLLDLRFHAGRQYRAGG